MNKQSHIPNSDGLRNSLTTLKLEGNPIVQSLPKDQYELYIRSLFPYIERIDDIQDTTITKNNYPSPGSVASSSGRTVHIHNENISDISTTKSTDQPPISSQRSVSPLQDKLNSLSSRLGNTSINTGRSHSPLASTRFTTSNPTVEAVSSAALTALELVEEIRSRASSLSRSSTPLSQTNREPIVPDMKNAPIVPHELSKASSDTQPDSTVIPIPTILSGKPPLPLGSSLHIPLLPLSTIPNVAITSNTPTTSLPVPSIPTILSTESPSSSSSTSTVTPVVPPTNILNKTPARPASISASSSSSSTAAVIPEKFTQDQPMLIAPPSPRSVTNKTHENALSTAEPSNYLGIPSSLTQSVLPPLTAHNVAIPNNGISMNPIITPARPISLLAQDTSAVSTVEVLHKDNLPLPDMIPSAISSQVSSTFPTPIRPISATPPLLPALPLVPRISTTVHTGNITNDERTAYEEKIRMLETKLHAHQQILQEYETSLGTAFAVAQQHETNKVNESETTNDEHDIDDDSTVSSHDTDSHSDSSSLSSSSSSSESSTTEDINKSVISSDIQAQAKAYTQTLSDLRQQYTDIYRQYHTQQHNIHSVQENYQQQVQALSTSLQQSELNKQVIDEELKQLKILLPAQIQTYQAELATLRENTYQMTKELSTLLQQRDTAVRETERLTRMNKLTEENLENLQIDMENLRTRHSQEITRLQLQLSRLTAGEEGRVSTMSEEVAALQVENMELKFQNTKLEQSLTIETNRGEQMNTRLQETIQSLTNTEKQLTSFKFALQESQKHYKALETCILSTVQPYIVKLQEKMETLQTIVHDALSQLALRIGLVTEEYRNRNLLHNIDYQLVGQLSEAISSERKIWEDAFVSQIQRKDEEYKLKIQLFITYYLLQLYTNISNNDSIEHISNIQSSSISSYISESLVSLLTPEEFEFIDSLFLQRPLTMSTTESLITTLSLQFEQLLQKHETEIQEGANVLSTVYEATNTLLQTFIQQMNIHHPSDESMTVAASIDTTLALTEPKSLLSSTSVDSLRLLSADALRERLITTLQEMQELKTRLHNVLAVHRTHESSLAASSNHRIHELMKGNDQLIHERDGLITKLNQLNDKRRKEQEEHTTTLAKIEATRVRQLTTAKDATLRVRSQVAQLETLLETERNQHNLAASDARRLEKEIVRLTEYHNEEHKKYLQEYTENLVKLRTELETLRNEKDNLQKSINIIPKLKEDIQILRKERNALVAVLGQSATTTVPTNGSNEGSGNKQIPTTTEFRDRTNSITSTTSSIIGNGSISSTRQPPRPLSIDQE